MSDLTAYDDSIENIFLNHLKIESNPMSVETLFIGRLRKRTTYDPYYQRNYVWDKHKASYFIESILLGTEIPPLIFFNSTGKIEVIDGRQRFETIDKFVRGGFDLTEKGLIALKGLARMKYDDLPDPIRDSFLETIVRVIEFSIIGVKEVDEAKEDVVKKEIFRRYNSGITPLRKSEFQKAYYIDDDVTKYFRDAFENNLGDYADVVRVFSSERNQSRLDEPGLLDEVMMLVRKLLVLPELPVKYYESSSGRDVASILYEKISHDADPRDTYADFMARVQVLLRWLPQVHTLNPANNRYLYEALYWSLAILAKEGHTIEIVPKSDLVDRLSKHVNSNSDVYDSETIVFRAETIARFAMTSDFFGEYFACNLSSFYVDNNGRMSVNKFRRDDATIDAIEDVMGLRVNKPDAQNITVEDLQRRMTRRRFLVRPSYQRYESITTAKASAIIESMLLGIKLPPIFVFERKDGIMEVVDGQQRILSILGFMKLPFVDEKEQESYSQKNGYKLRNLRLLKELNGKSFSDLDLQLQDRLWDFKLYQVTIGEKVNPEFDPVDLYIRLNNKPYPIKDNTFEMWNSFVDKDTVQEIKEKSASCGTWFYLRVDNRRMDNENLFTTLSFLNYRLSTGELDSALEFFRAKKGGIYSRIKSKSDVTEVLELVSRDPSAKQRFAQAIREMDAFVRKVKTLLIDRDVPENVDKWLERELNSLFDSDRRTQSHFYILWFILRDIKLSMVRHRREVLKPRIWHLMRFVRNSEQVDESRTLDFFHEVVNSIRDDHRASDRQLRLNKVETSDRIKSQENRCPLCKEELYLGEDVEVDHIIPISIGGPDSLDNVQIVHWICNREKGNDFLLS